MSLAPPCLSNELGTRRSDGSCKVSFTNIENLFYAEQEHVLAGTKVVPSRAVLKSDDGLQPLSLPVGRSQFFIFTLT